ncbi:hypothetical protein [Bailinhaonella thermotolerans]|uniref:Uncharacterized protein n=1 Tax=Bailinhaonella thermotolerans TaxID=1070861 RepID=A0A3A4ASD8_9ACTN|nr:hypothetical protein [Bailinhaonella thermotolerans]RJL24238.1 hypothetical protein D5H75_30860 [Bailinhaonella thermotolerans]
MGTGRPGLATARAHGLFNIVSGVWPLLGMRGFERVFGPKEDDWLVRVVAGLLIGIGYAQLRAPDTPEGVATARRLGLATATTLLAIDLTYVPRGRISPVYLLDAATETAWLTAWLRPRPAGAMPSP